MWSDAKMPRENTLWYLVHCQPRKEAYAANSLRHLLNLPVFLPETCVHLRRVTRSSSFFPGYLFISADLRQVPKSHINTCPGVLRLVEFGGSPQSVPQDVIDVISQQLNKLNGRPMLPAHNFHPGDVVQVKSGPLQHLEMIFVGSATLGNRVQVLLEFLGRLKTVQVDVDLLEKAPVPSFVSHED